jgi:hypothetical protein
VVDFGVEGGVQLRIGGPCQQTDDFVALEEVAVLGWAGGTCGTAESLMKSPSTILVMLYSPIDYNLFYFYCDRFHEATSRRNGVGDVSGGGERWGNGKYGKG